MPRRPPLAAQRREVLMGRVRWLDLRGMHVQGQPQQMPRRQDP